MKEADRLARNKQRLMECFPAFANRVASVIAEMEAQGFRPRIQDAHRTIEQQLDDFNKETSTIKFGFHNVTGAGGKPESLAVDMLDDDRPLDTVRKYVITLAFVAQNHGLHSGIHFFKKEPPPGTRERLRQAVNDLNFDSSIVIGFDPTHLEPTGLTVAQAQTDARPT
jgi:hypothetical protein